MTDADKNFIQIASSWWSKEELAAWKEALAKNWKEYEHYLLFGGEPPKVTPEDPRKWAEVEVNGQRMSLPVDKATMKCYKTDENRSWTWEEVPDYKFLRWSRMMDL